MCTSYFRKRPDNYIGTFREVAAREQNVMSYIDAYTYMVVYCVIKLDYKKSSETKRGREKEWGCFAEEIKRANKGMASREHVLRGASERKLANKNTDRFIPFRE